MMISLISIKTNHCVICFQSFFSAGGKKYNTRFYSMMMYSVAMEMLERQIFLERCYDLKVERMCKEMQNKKVACSIRPNYGRKYPEKM